MVGYLRVAAVLLCAAASSCHGARILAVFPALSRSHVISFSSLTRELARRGHEVVVVSSWPHDRPLDNYTDVVIPLDMFGLDVRYDLLETQQLSIFDSLHIVWEVGVNTCDHYLSHPAVQRLIHTEQHFDLLIVEVFLNECFLGFAHLYAVPVVGVSVFDAQHWSLAVVGNPSPYAFTPNIFLSYGDHMTLIQRLVNTLGTTVIQCFKEFVNLPQQDKLMRKYFNQSGLPYAGELEKMTSLLLLNSHVSLGYPRPYMPNVVEVGGMHIAQTPQSLPEDLQTFMDEAEHGVVLFSMGTNLRSSQMPADTVRAFVDAFSRLRQRVLWRWDVDEVAGLSANVRLGKWLPQSAILAHPNMRLLLTHGGLLSMQEAVFNGVPMVGIPIFADQGQNMHRAEHHGFGVRLEMSDVSAESVYRALDTVLHQPSYRAAAKRVSARFRDQIATPLEKAVYWTEYVLRHGGATHLRSATLDLAWYQYFLLDVLAILALACIAVAVAGYHVAKAVARLLNATYVENNKKKKKVQ